MQTVWLGEAGDEDEVREESPEVEDQYEEEDPPDQEWVEPEVQEIVDVQTINWRGKITEFCQKRELHLPEVNEIQTCGARGTFSFVCKFNWGHVDNAPLLILRTCGTAKKKKFAKREAARLMCSRLSDLTNFPEPLQNEHNPEDRGYWGPSFPACPRSADESGEVCPPLGYEEFDHSEPLPNIWGSGYDDQTRVTQKEDTWEDDKKPSPRFHPYQRGGPDVEERRLYRGGQSSFGRMPFRSGRQDFDGRAPWRRGSMFL